MVVLQPSMNSMPLLPAALLAAAIVAVASFLVLYFWQRKSIKQVAPGSVRKTEDTRQVRLLLGSPTVEQAKQRLHQARQCWKIKAFVGWFLVLLHALRQITTLQLLDFHKLRTACSSDVHTAYTFSSSWNLVSFVKMRHISWVV